MKKTLLALLALVPLLTFAQVANDECATATVLTVSPDANCTTTTTNTTQGATASAGALTCTGFADDDIWYSFTATNERAFIKLALTNTTAANPYAFAVYEASCSSASIYCGNTFNNVINNLTVGQVYYVRVYSTANAYTLFAPFTICIATPQTAITTSSTAYTPTQLVTDVLLNSNQVAISNVTSSSGVDFGSVASLGSFDYNGTTFALQNGIILANGAIATAPGPNTFFQSPPAVWAGDPDLVPYIPATSTVNTNATSLEFDFVPVSSQISLNYIFASEEYGLAFQCMYADTFAILLTDVTEATPAVNIAVIPGTTTPISVFTIRDNAYNSGCPSANAQYFDEFYGLQSDLTDTSYTAPVNFNGITVPLTAQASVIPNHTYHIKFVIANHFDMIGNSAVFINASNFVVIPDAPTGQAEQTFIYGTTIEYLTATGQNIQWYATPTGGTPLNIETLLTDGTVYYASQTVDNIESTERFAVTAIELLDIGFATYNTCESDADGFATFTLSSQNTIVLNVLEPEDYTVAYFLTEADAEANLNALPDVFTNTVAYSQTIYARVTEVDGTTYAVTTITLNVTALPDVSNLPALTSCDGSFNLTEIQNAIGYQFYLLYFPTEEDAISLTNAIDFPANYSTTTTGSIWIRATYVSGIDNESCVAIGEQELIVNDAITVSLSTSGQTITVVTSVPGTYQYALDSGPYQTSNVFTNVSYGTHTVTVLTECSTVYLMSFTVAPDAPEGQTTQTFIEGETIDDLEVEGENIKWYATETGGTPLDKTATLNSLTLLVDGATYYASQTIDGVESTQRLGITVTKILSTNSNTIAGLAYYPNPVKNLFTLTHKAAIDTVKVYNTLGQQVLAKTVNNSQAMVDFSALNGGIYFVKVQAGNSQQTIKVVKE
ncbi:choice-of-anchor L domain-containing protein [Flavobacterium subsaxonicum]|uniref:Uncharacterized protein n=1 Tax=Flavobacterium subsaxonicum WB 4.1-42 = DSM 21790 TaxID=1121898 RepID=A0A0A2MVJ1_9FLAO|nr:choice-of-anchor L domain-containing protein [Flavobacterium subsaxonicum]KGO92225.1 hypothetical protein Q766_13790 [Flavobacterium subsaxonicum WB 4.1-42 = DSM 21790]